MKIDWHADCPSEYGLKDSRYVDSGCSVCWIKSLEVSDGNN